MCNKYIVGEELRSRHHCVGRIPFCLSPPSYLPPSSLPFPKLVTHFNRIAIQALKKNKGEDMGMRVCVES